MKKCSKCKQLKTLDCFSKDKSRHDGLDSKCKECGRLRQQSLTNLGYFRKRYQDNQADPIKRAEKAAYHQTYNQTYKLSINKEKRKQYNNAYFHKRKVDPQFKIARNARTRIWIALKGHVKADSTMDLIGCSRKHLMSHLESQFQAGMSWTNYGDWHVDHIKPCASFDLSSPEQQAKCFHYSNLQPLWAADNLSKSDNFPLPKYLGCSPKTPKVNLLN